jgi:hypothetical protein
MQRANEMWLADLGLLAKKRAIMFDPLHVRLG